MLKLCLLYFFKPPLPVVGVERDAPVGSGLGGLYMATSGNGVGQFRSGPSFLWSSLSSWTLLSQVVDWQLLLVGYLVLMCPNHFIRWLSIVCLTGSMSTLSRTITFFTLWRLLSFSDTSFLVQWFCSAWLYSGSVLGIGMLQCVWICCKSFVSVLPLLYSCEIDVEIINPIAHAKQ